MNPTLSESVLTEYKTPSYELRNRPERPALGADYPSYSRYQYSEGVWKSTAEDKDEVTLLFAGDLLCQERMIQAYAKDDGSYDFTLCFDHIRPLLQSADLTIGNLETPVSETAPYRGEIITHEGPFYCNAPIEYLGALKYAGFDVLTTANNHTIDAGLRGLLETIENTQNLGFMQTGTFATPGDRFLLINVCGFKVGIVAFSTTYNSMQSNLTGRGRTQHLNTYLKHRAEDIIRELRERGAEYVVCVPHWGREYTDVISNKQSVMAEELTQLGYDFIVGSHSHVVQRFEYVNDTPVAYSLGNLISHLNSLNDTESQHPALCRLRLSRDSQQKIVPKIDFIPCKIVKDHAGVPFTVIPTLTPSEEPLLDRDKVRSEVDRLLGSATTCTARDFTFTAEAVSGYANTLITIESRKALIQGLAESSINNLNPPDDRVTKDGVAKFGLFFKKQEDGLALTAIESLATVIKIPEVVDDAPVLYLAMQESLSIYNETARVIYIPSTIKEIAAHSFENYSKLESVRLFKGLETVGEAAFANCSNMTGIILPNTVTKIDARAFSNCTNLLSIKIPKSVIEIADNAFEGCTKLVIFCESNSYAEEYANTHDFSFSIMPLTSSPKKKNTVKGKSEKNPAGSGTRKTSSIPDPVCKIKTKLGPMNANGDDHPISIRAACEALGTPLPYWALCKHQPSRYIKEGILDGSFEQVQQILTAKGLYPEIDEEWIQKRYRMFKRKFKSQKNLTFTNTDLAVYFTDWLVYARNRGFTHNCYFDYELYRKEPDIRDTFLNEGYRIRVHQACSKKAQRKIFLDKAEFNKTFEKYVRRRWVDSSTCTYEEFTEFARSTQRFFGKPVRGTGGAGARIVEISEKTDMLALFEECKNDELICEEVIQQHPSLAEFNSDTLNTVRITTLLCADNTPRIVLTVARFGREGNCVDNFHGGGVGAIVDIETGRITSEAINMGHQRKPFHPDSKKMILGFTYPEWEKVKEAVLDAATMVPEMRNIGWDVSVAEDGHIEFVEGNGRPNYDVLQSPDQIGRRFRYEPYLQEIEKMNGIAYEEAAPLAIKLKGERLRKIKRSVRFTARKIRRKYFKSSKPASAKSKKSTKEAKATESVKR